jgi:hypothetical protein
VHIRFSPKFFEELIEFEVDMNEIHLDKNLSGKDVLVNWRFLNGFNNNGRFWTDSNALSMQERVFNHHDSWDFMGRDTSVYDKNNFNVSNNYYPVDSAIAMRDFNGTDLQVTILNDRPQGGSGYLNNNTIELMQHRRTTDDDAKGVLEALNETDKNEFGVQVNARYFVQIFDFKRAKSL